MSDEKKYTEKDLVLAKREGWVDKATALSVAFGGYDPAYARDVAASIYPLPKVTRPRRIVDSVKGEEYQWRLNGGTLEWASWGYDDWDEYGSGDLADGEWPDLIRIIARLLANPTEEVEDT